MYEHTHISYRFYVHTDNNNNNRNAKYAMHECEKFIAKMLKKKNKQKAEKKETPIRTQNGQCVNKLSHFNS